MKKSVLNKKGFTLIEVIVVLVIMGIVATIAVPSFVGYINRAQQNSRMKNAESIFNVSQSALKSKNNRMVLNLVDNDGNVELSKITPSMDETLKESLGDDIAFMKIDKGQANVEDSNLYKLIGSRVTDESIFDNSIVMEYNKESGSVVAVFYSDDVELGYGEDAEYSVYNINEDDLKENNVGWHSTIPIAGSSDVEEDKETGVKLYDHDTFPEGAITNIGEKGKYGLLEADITMPKTLIANRKYTVSVMVKKSVTSDSVLSKKITFTTEDLSSMAVNLSSSLSSSVPGLYTTMVAGRRHVYYTLDSATDSDKLFVNQNLLDDNNSYERNPVITIEVTGLAKSADSKNSSFAENAYFKTADYAISGESPKVEISSIRHVKYLNENIKNTIQIKDIICKNNTGSNVNWPTLTLSNNSTFDGNGYRIYNVTIKDNGNDYVGLFSKIQKGSVAKNIYMDYNDEYNSETYVYGKYYVGGIAGYNAGEIDNCQVMGKINGQVMVGGIVGMNADTGAIVGCYVGADVKARSFDNAENASKNSHISAGGIVGENFGLISKCEVGTFATRSDTLDRAILVGVPYYGITDNKKNYVNNNNSTLLGKVENNANTISGVATINKNNNSSIKCYVGGIVGYCQNTEISSSVKVISECVNAAQISLTSSGSSNNGNIEESCAGGLIGNMPKALKGGYNQIEYSYNAGNIVSSLDEAYLGGLVGKSESPNNGVSSDRAMVTKCYSTGNIIAGYSKSNGKKNNGNGKKDYIYYAGTMFGNLDENSAEYNYTIGEINYSDGTMYSPYGQFTIKNKSSVEYNYFIDTQDLNDTDYDYYFIEKESSSLKKLNWTENTGTNPLKENGFAVANSYTQGLFDYEYPVFGDKSLNVQSGNSKLNSFHRTPWQ